MHVLSDLGSPLKPLVPQGTPQDPSQGTPRARLEICRFLDVISATKMHQNDIILAPKISPASIEN